MRTRYSFLIACVLLAMVVPSACALEPYQTYAPPEWYLSHPSAPADFEAGQHPFSYRAPPLTTSSQVETTGFELQEVNGNISYVTNDAYLQQYPRISGSRIVWMDGRNGNWDIYLYDRATGVETQITDDPVDQIMPAISGDRIIWIERRVDGFDICSYDLASGAGKLLSTGQEGCYELQIDGDTAVWSCNWDVYLYDFLSGNLVSVTPDGAGGYYPSISGDRIVWDHNGDIYLYTISTGTTEQLTSDTASQWRPLISGDTVVWVEDNYLVLYDLSTGEKRQLMDMTVNWMYPNAISGNLLACEINGDIYLYDCTSGMAQQLTDDDLYQYSPSISGTAVVWTTDTTAYSGEIYLYDTNTATETKLTDNDGWWSLPVVSGDRVIWRDEDGTVIQDLVTGIKTWILTDQDGLNWESCDGDFVAGTGYRQGQYDLFYCNVSSGTLIQVTNDTQQEYYIGVSGTHIAWISNSDVYLYSISDGKTEQLTNDSASHGSSFSAISGDRVAWLNDGSDIYLYTISTGVTSQLTNDGELRDSLDISGDRVIWHEDSDIVTLDLVAGTRTLIGESSARCSAGVISGDLVAYLVDYGWHNDLALYDLSTGSETRITTDVFDQWDPDIDGNHLIWADNRDYNTDICLFSAPQEDSTTNTICFEPGSSLVTVGASKNITIIIDTVPDGLSGFNVTVALTDPSVGEIVGVSYPSWASMPVNGSLPADAVYTQAVDLMSSVGAGATNVTLCTLTVHGDAIGETNLTITATKIDDDVGGRYAPEITDAILIVESLPAPFANFTANVTAGTAPLDVQFTDLSSQDPSGWAWYFGDEDFKDPWTQVTASPGWAGREDQSSVALPDGSIVLMGGINAEGVTHYFNDVWKSTDYGETWTQVNASAGWSSRCRANSVVLPDGSIVLMGGLDGRGTKLNDIWRSMDSGATWIRMNASAGWSKRYYHSSVAMPDGSIVVMGGYDGGTKNDVWRSTDMGVTWTLMTANAAWSPRTQQNSVVMPDGSIILMGGYNGTTYLSDVWRSTDYGATWTQVTESSGWGWNGRLGFTSVAIPDGSIVLMGGSYQNDVWRSTDNGATWTQIIASAEWMGRMYHNSVSLPDGSIILIGGVNSTWDYQDDIWRLVTAGSSAQHPLHTYIEPGIYQIALQAYNAGGSDSVQKVGYINVTGTALPVANFTANVTAGPAPLTVRFTDTSTGNPTAWLWDFGDGATSTERHPVHTYTAAGTYTVNLTAMNDAGSDTLSRLLYVTVVDAMPIGLGDAGAAKGQTTQALLTIRNASAIGGGSLDLDYDPAIVTVDAVSLASPWMGASNIDNANGKARISYFTTYGQSGDVPICTVTLRATGEPGDVSPLNINATELVNANGQDVTFAALPIPGDFQVLYPDTPDPVRYRDVASLYKGILSGNTLYFGEEDLNLTQLGNVQQLVHYSNFSAGTVDATIGVPDCRSFDPAPGENPMPGRYYAWGDDGLLNGRPWVEIWEPSTGLDVLLNGTNASVDGITLTRNVALDFALENNLEGLHTIPAAAVMDIEITTPGGGKLTQFGGTDLTGIPVNASTVYVSGISLSSTDPGSYTARAVWPSASDFAGKGFDSNTVTFDVVERPLTIDSGTDRVTRGKPFNVTINGDNRAQYILYVRNAGPMIESEYPLIAAGQPGVRTGDTVAAPADAANFTFTRAYVVTDLAGYRTVQFNTSPVTADMNFTIRVVDASTGQESDEVTVQVDPGRVTLTASGGGRATIGDEITLSGMNSDSSTVYLFLTGPGLNAAGANLVNLSMPVVSDNPSTFTVIYVGADDTWEYRWDTSTIAGSLTDGLYTVYAAALPRPRTDLTGVASATAEIRFASPSNASFTADTTTGVAPLTVRFADTSSNSPTAWLWTFGDGNTSTEQHPTHTYTSPGNHTVTLSVNGGAEIATKPGYIKVTPVLFGDANEDGKVNQADTLLVLQEVVGLRETPAAGTDRFQKTDTHTNGVIEVGDALFIAQCNVGLRDVWFELL